MQYILDDQPKDEGCVLCRYTEPGPGADELLLVRRASCYVVLNKYPYNAGHVMVVPVRHTCDLGELTLQEHAAFFRLVTDAVGALRRATGCHALNVGMNLGRTAGAGIDEHLHMHLVPRWDGDHNFMAVLGDVRVIPELLRETRVRLLEHFLPLADEGQ